MRLRWQCRLGGMCNAVEGLLNVGEMEEQEDGFLRFVESARNTLGEFVGGEDREAVAVGWSWVCWRVLECCRAYPSGVTDAIVLSDLYQAWLDKESMERRRTGKARGDGEGVVERKWRQQRPRLEKTVSIDSVLEKKFVALDAVLEAVILDVHLLPGTSSYLLKLGDVWSSSSVELYLHRKFYHLIADGGPLRPQREIRLTGCRLRVALDSASIPPRLLPTEYMVVLLFEEHDEDALLLGARFFSDTISCIKPDPLQTQTEYCLYARLENIGAVESAEQCRLVRLQLRDSNDDTMLFILWDDQICFVNLLSEGSMIALERPSLTKDADTGIRTPWGFCLEHGSGTRIYTVPYVPNKEQVTVGAAQSQSHVPHTLSMGEVGYMCSSQVTLPLDSQGSLDYSNFPFRLLIENLRLKMSYVTLFGQVVSIVADRGSPSIFLLSLADRTGLTIIKLQFPNYWSACEIWGGHLLFITGLVTVQGASGRVDCIWNERDNGSKLVNVTQLPALLSSSSLHEVVPVSKLAGSSAMQVCKIRLTRMRAIKMDIVPSHTKCGRSVQTVAGAWSCGFCCRACESREVANMFCSEISFCDSSGLGDAVEAEAICRGQAAAEILQTTPEDFTSWPMDQQATFLCFLENKEYLVSLCTDSTTVGGTKLTIARALKCD